MKIAVPSFGFISAIATSTIFLPHALVILGINFLHQENLKDPTPMFLFFTIIARLVGDWMFWTKFFPQEMDSGENSKNWRSSVKNILKSEPSAIKAMNDMIIDAVIDGLLLYLAFRVSDLHIWILFVFSFCQAVGAPIQGIALRLFKRQNLRKFSMAVTALATFMSLEANGLTSVAGYSNMFGLSSFSASTQIFFILGAKCLFTGTSVIAKEIIAETIKIKTMNEFKTVIRQQKNNFM